MKELSIEEKAKRYDEALEKAKSKIKNDKDHVLYEYDVIEMFPELKESREDEMIRIIKEVILNSVPYKINILTKDTTITAEEAIAWLEKQGEQKSITFNNAYVIDSALNDYCCKQYSALHKENGGVLSFARLQHLAMDIYGWCKEQSEQKPAGWSEEDEYCLDGAIETEMYMLDVVNGIKKFDVGNESIKEECTRELNWLKSLKDRVQPKQEWNEEDKIYISDVLWCVEQARKVAKDENDMGTTWCAERWLKTLKDRYTWRPSDRQMNVLEHYMHTLVCNEHKEILFGLYTDLKKLRGV